MIIKTWDGRWWKRWNDRWNDGERGEMIRPRQICYQIESTCLMEIVVSRVICKRICAFVPLWVDGNNYFGQNCIFGHGWFWAFAVPEASFDQMNDIDAFLVRNGAVRMNRKRLLANLPITNDGSFYVGKKRWWKRWNDARNQPLKQFANQLF